MAELPEIGKISAEIFNELIYPRLGAKNKSILVGPQHGVDVGIVRIGNQAVAMTSDPVFIVPEYGFERAAWFALHILASDIVTSGLRPTYLSIDLNLPMSMSKKQLGVVWRTIHEESKKMGMAVICGHTARYDKCQYPMVGGATVIGVGPIDKYVSPCFAKPGARIIITKGPAIEAAGIFATMFPAVLAREFGSGFSRKAQKLFYKMSVVDDAMTAIKVGVRDQGITAMHDATECGIWGGVYEIARAAGVGVRITKDLIVRDKYAMTICDYFQIDPYKAISEGTLIITCRENKAEAVVDILRKKNIDSSVVGELTRSKHGMVVIEGNKAKELKHPIVDPFWNAFYRALDKHTR